MMKFLFCPLQRDMFEERRDGGDRFSNSGFPVGVWRRSEVQRNVVFELSASDATRCSPIKVEMRRVVAVELHIFRNYEARTSSSATPNGRPNTTGHQLPVAGPRNPRSEADRGWLQRLVRCILLILESCGDIQYILCSELLVTFIPGVAESRLT